MEELGISSVVLSTEDDVLLPIGEAKHQFVFGVAKDFQNMLKNKGSPQHNCVTLSATRSRLGLDCKTVASFANPSDAGSIRTKGLELV